MVMNVNFKKMFPKWGDKHRSNENDVSFSNTCTVDNWLALVYITANSRPQLFSGIIDKYFGESSDLMAILGLAQKCDWGMAKFKLARLNNLNLYKKTFDFYGDEYSLFTKHLEIFTTHTITSTCSSDFCPMKVLTEDRKNFPSFQSCDEVNIVQKIKSWFIKDWSVKCLKPLCKPLPSDDFIHWEFNNEL